MLGGWPLTLTFALDREMESDPLVSLPDSVNNLLVVVAQRP